MVTVWQNLGLTFIVISAGLQGIPEDLYEAAQVDGAGPATRFWQVTIPMLSPTLFFVFVIGTINAFQSFGQIDLLTSGGPFKHTNTLTYSIYGTLNPERSAADPGRAAVLSIALFFITLGLTLVQMRVMERRVHYAALNDPGRDGRSWRTVGSYALLSVLAFIVLFPIYITIVNSLLRPVDIAARPPSLFPVHPEWGAYREAWTGGHMSKYLVNSFIVTMMITVGQVATAVLAGYAFAFLDFRFKRIIFAVFLATLMVPFEVTVVTNIDTISRIGWYDTYQGLAVPFLATGFGAFLMRQAFLQVPPDLSTRRRSTGTDIGGS